MERIQIYKTQKGYALFFTIFGLISFGFGITMLFSSLKNGFKTEFLGGDWNYVIYTIQGFLFFIIGHSYKKYEKYFIEWDEKELRYFLPKNKSIETIILSEIKAISIKLFQMLPNQALLRNIANLCSLLSVVGVPFCPWYVFPFVRGMCSLLSVVTSGYVASSATNGSSFAS